MLICESLVSTHEQWDQINYIEILLRDLTMLKIKGCLLVVFVLLAAEGVGQSLLEAPKLHPGQNNNISAMATAEPLGLSDTSGVSVNLKDPDKAIWKSVFHFLIPTLTGFAVVTNQNKFGQSGDVLERVGAALIGYGFLVGPSIGHFYANANRKGMNGVMIRTGGVAAMGFGYLNLILAGFASWGNEASAATFFMVSGAVFAIGGAVLSVGRIFHDIFAVDESAEKYNREIKSNKKVSVAPFISLRTGGGGLSLRVQL
jgi:hypothetical protein